MLGVIPSIGYAFVMQGVSDEQLMKQYAAGNMRAFESLYERFRGPLFRYFQRQIRDPATVNDLYQGSWEKLIKARTSYRPSVPFRAWLFRIAHNHMVDHFRANRIFEPLKPEQFASSENEPGEQIDQDQQLKRFYAALKKLPDEQKDALLLKLEAGLGLLEIGRVTGVEYETVKSRLRYAAAKLKRSLNT
ncbi:MAG: sigma-70 family RNA polymerase sigma factor [Xanthomonadales bacterium]|nr:sigma-70 family RNA polymerase sigma factor [Xanthomonadales bacterium]NNL95467.1 sigma-70 family RNA polymerase sigma factor [Xanthomonadales bacterium]